MTEFPEKNRYILGLPKSLLSILPGFLTREQKIRKGGSTKLVKMGKKISKKTEEFPFRKKYWRKTILNFFIEFLFDFRIFENNNIIIFKNWEFQKFYISDFNIVHMDLVVVLPLR